jgi:hypothetical protein
MALVASRWGSMFRGIARHARGMEFEPVSGANAA